MRAVLVSHHSAGFQALAGLGGWLIGRPDALGSVVAARVSQRCVSELVWTCGLCALIRLSYSALTDAGSPVVG